jgi:Phage integrase, N-terminal SAM-like domain
MPVPIIDRPVSALRQRMIEDMAMRGLRSDTQHEYIRFVRSFAAFLGQPPDTATAEDIRRFQVHQRESGVQPPTINCSVSALRFFFTVTLDRPDLSRRLVLARYPRKLPSVLSGRGSGPTARSATRHHQVAAIAVQNKTIVYDLLFRAASETMMMIAADPKHLGAHIGITAVLHTWGSAMTESRASLHHIGGSDERERWLPLAGRSQCCLPRAAARRTT